MKEVRYNKYRYLIKNVVCTCYKFIQQGGFIMKLALILGVAAVFILSNFTAGYDAKPGVPKDNQ